MVMIRKAMVAALVCAASVSMAQLAEHVPGELMVKFVPGQGALLNAKIGAQAANYNSATGFTRVILPRNMTVQQGMSYYGTKLEVMVAEPNFIYRNQWTPNDPRVGQQYALPRTQAFQGWDVMRGAPDIIIAIVDTGVSKDHEDLAAKLVPGYDFVNGDDDPDDDQGHGTHCAGIAAAITNNGKGIAGMAPDCSIMPVKALSAAGGGTAQWISDGIRFAADNGAHVISMSLGGFGVSTAIRDACTYALGRGSFLVAAAGNHGTTQIAYPAGYPEVMAVANTDSNDNRNPGSAYGDWVDVAAPGTNIMSTLPGNAYGSLTGTSMACPYVAGLAGLVKASWRTATAQQIRQHIAQNSDYVGNFVIYGRINVLRSVPTQTTTDPYSLAPLSATMFEGTVTTGNASHVAASDNAYFTVVSREISRVGHVASMKAVFRANRNPSSISQLGLEFETNAPKGVTANFFVWDNTSGSWLYMGATPMTGADVVRKFTMGTPYGKYWNPNRELQVLVRCVMPTSIRTAPTQFNMKVDMVKLTGRIPR